jgi:DNA polymerase elongation subunit (family B)
MNEYQIPLSEVESFLLGYDDEKYIVNLEYDKPTNLIYKFKQLPDGTKVTETESLKAFLWMKHLGDLRQKINFYGNNDLNIQNARKEFGINITPLSHHDHPKLKNGYRYLVTCDQGYERLLEFFKKGGFYRGIYDKTHGINEHFLILSPVEQYLISTGKRLFKGYEDYNNLEKFVFDLETTGLDPRTSRIFLVGCKSNNGFEELFDCETEGEDADKTEVAAIAKFFAAIDYLKPSIIGGYNSANFDWDFIFKRCEILGVDITKLAKTLKDGELINNKDNILKLGNEVENYTQTNMFGYSIIDIIHSARRAQAIDSSMKSASLKYVCKYNKVAKKNRVYIKGDKIGALWKSNKKYYFDDKTGSYFETKLTFEREKFITREMVRNNPKKIFVFGDNDEREGYGGQAGQMRGEKNVIGIPTKKKPTMDPDSFYTDLEFDKNKQKINFAVSQIINKIKDGYSIVIPSDGLGTGLAELPQRAPKTYQFLVASLNAIEKYINVDWVEVDGKYIVRRYLMDDLWETMEVDNIYNQTSFMLAKMVPTTYQRVSTMGTAGLWKLLMLAWSYEKGLAVPLNDTKREFVGGLSRLLKVGFSKDLRKMDFDSLYPAIQLAHDVFPSVDVSGVMKSFLKYFHSERFKAKDLAKKYGKEGNKQLESLYKRKQLPLKIFINSMFGALGAPNAFQWAEMDVAEGITCRARQYLRLMVKFFMKKGYTPTVLDTDGVNFMAPEGGEDHFYYVGKGINNKVIVGKEYRGAHAVLAEFNDLYMKGEMALGLDGMWPSTINLARKNYALLEDDGSISLTGNTIKSKKIPVYIEEFLDKAIVLLLNGKGYEFVQLYYDYVGKIYDKKIPLAKIATKARVKKTIEQYKNRGVNKNGQPLPKQAHMELAIHNNIPVNLGDTIYYINNGTKKSHGDIQTTKKCKLKAAEVRLYEINNGKSPGLEFYDVTEKINCYILDEKQIETNSETLGDYNVEKYIAMFNSRIKGLLVNFDLSVRNKILITTPEDKKNWMVSELNMVNNQPNKESDQDTIEELFTPSDMELVFWDKMNYTPNFWFKDNITFTLPGLGREVEV